MCGIVGYIGHREAQSVLTEGLRRLSYHGYDSVGLATLTGPGQLHVRKRAGRVADLIAHLGEQPAPGCVGVGHTRWATHGPATDANAHPHTDDAGLVAVVHNGVIENYAGLRRQLAADGAVFRSDTDTEVIAHLIAHHFGGDLAEAVRATLPLLQGTYALAVVCAEDPDVLVGACFGSPLVLGVGAEEHFLASDPAALVGHTDRMVALEDHQLCILTLEDWQIFDRERILVAAPPALPSPALEEKLGGGRAPRDAAKGAYEHHMLKEIHEQPEALVNALRGRLDDAEAGTHFGGLNVDSQQLRKAERLILTGCGTSYHAALVGEYLIEELARVPVEVEYASEFRYRNPPVDRNTIVLAVSQSGETADTLAALRESKRKGHTTLALCNVVGSSIAREADGGIYLHAGPEIGVASTKAFTSQVLTLAMLALHLGRLRHVSALQGARMLAELRAVPELVRRALTCQDAVLRVAERYGKAANFLFLGRHSLYPVALEGALKLKEVSYIHADGYPAAEMKHGPIALVDNSTPSVFLALRGPLFEKTMSNLEEVKARGGPIIVIATEGDRAAAERADEVIYVPETPDYLQPLTAVVPLQLLSYHIARLRGCNVDKPRHLAKSVTVE
jgi:glutamine---fructose-6-phosphate transaminase (isomerizing)